MESRPVVRLPVPDRVAPPPPLLIPQPMIAEETATRPVVDEEAPTAPRLATTPIADVDARVPDSDRIRVHEQRNRGATARFSNEERARRAQLEAAAQRPQEAYPDQSTGSITRVGEADGDESTDPVSVVSLTGQRSEPTASESGVENSIIVQQAHKLLVMVDTIRRALAYRPGEQLVENPELKRVKDALRISGPIILDFGDRFHLEQFESLLREHIGAVERDPSEKHLRELGAVANDIFNELRRFTELSAEDQARMPIAITEPVRRAKLSAHRAKMFERGEQRRQRTIPINTPATPTEGAQLPLLSHEDLARMSDERQAAEHNTRMTQYLVEEEATHAVARAEIDQRVAEYVAETRAAREAARVAEMEREASERRVAREARTQAEIAHSVRTTFDALRTHNDTRQNTADADSRPSARAVRIIEARAAAHARLAEMEEAAQNSFFTGLRNSLARANERRHINTYSQQLEAIYSQNPGVQNEIRTMLTEPHLALFTRTMDRKAEQREYQDKKLTNAHLAAVFAQNPDRQRIRAIQLEKVLALTTGERRLRSNNVAQQTARDFMHFSQRITQLRNTIQNTKPGFFNRLLGTDPVEAQRKELAYSEQRLQALIEQYPQLIP